MRTAVLSLALLSGCMYRWDLDEPIGLVPGPSLSEHQVEMVAAAAGCWEVGFGVPFVLDAHSTAAQQVSVELNELACVGRLGQYVPGQRGEIDLCPYNYWYPGAVTDHDFFLIILHELGHASGINEHSSVSAAVMGRATSAYFGSDDPVFDDDDARLFYEANGSSREPGCEVRLFGESSEATPACRCTQPCEPDVLEPNDLSQPVGLDADADLTLCVGDLDAFIVPAGTRLRIDSSDPTIAVIRSELGSHRSEGIEAESPGVYALDVRVETVVSVQQNVYSRDYPIPYRIRFLTE